MPESAWALGRGREVGVRDVEHGFRAAERPAKAGRRGPGGGDGRRGEHDGRYGSRFRAKPEIGRASSRERVCQYGSVSVVAVTLKKKIQQEHKLKAKRHRRKF